MQAFLHINRVLKYDPSRTKLLRDAYVREMNKRFMRIRRLIKEAIVDRDVFGLKSPTVLKSVALLPKQFAFNTLPEKVDGFMDWLSEEVDKGILEVTRREGKKVVGHWAWQNTYIDAAYKRGMKRGTAELKKAGIKPSRFPEEPIFPVEALFNRPIHADRVGLMYTRTFNELKGITDAMDQMISRSLAESLAEGRSPWQMARILMNRIEKVGDLSLVDAQGRFIPALRRARMLARTETIRAHHAATINTYREAGVEGVRVKAEWSTAGDDRVCERCEALEGRIYKLDEIEGMIPLHPLCRCIALPAEIKVAKAA